MGKFDGILLAADFDDTLLGSDLTVCQRNKDAVRDFISEGGAFAVATGRAYSAFVNHWQEVPMNAPTILSNGSAIYDFPGGRWLHQSFLPDQTPRRLAEVTEAFPDLAVETYHGEDICAFRPNWVTEMHMKRVNAACTVCPISEMPAPWNKVLFEGEHALLCQVRDYLSARWPEEYEVIFSNQVLLEWTAKGCHKGAMVLRIADLLGIDHSQIYCVGDNENDLPMLAVSAIPFAPSNCAQVVRDWGAHIVCSCDEGCVADIIGYLDRLRR